MIYKVFEMAGSAAIVILALLTWVWIIAWISVTLSQGGADDR
jgi:hypothetical protein